MKDAKRLVVVLAILVAAIGVMTLAVACSESEEETSGGATQPVVTPPAKVTATPAVASQAPGTCPTPSGTAPGVNVKTYAERPPLTIDANKTYLAHMYTTRGHFIIQLLPKLAPEHVNSFVYLAREGFYNGIKFHRVEPGFVVQGGDPTGRGSGGPGYTIPLEPSEEPFVRGVVGMARTSDPDSAGSQWFVTLGDALFLNDTSQPLNKRYTVFGKVVLGMEIVDCITVGDAIISIVIQEQ